jgi:hypothetical protein
MAAERCVLLLDSQKRLQSKNDASPVKIEHRGCSHSSNVIDLMGKDLNLGKIMEHGEEQSRKGGMCI